MEATPICRCRVLWLGSAVPQQTKDGLQGIQEPLRELYPSKAPRGACHARGIDSWLSVWSNGILLENVDENHKKVTRFFPIESLHYCAAVRHVGAGGNGVPRFLPLDSPFARAPSPSHPPLFAAILRRTTGIKVLECHAFICKKEMAANALVRCCFHAYADSSYAKAAGGMNGSVKESRTNVEEEEEEEEDVYDGDENHKVWAGSQENLDESPYDIYGTGSRGKTPRPRQVSRPAPVPPPPPPPPVTATSTSTGKKQKKQQRRSNSSTNIREEGMRSMGGPRGHPPPWAQMGSYAATLPPPRLRPQYATVEPRPLRAARSLAALDAPHLGAAARRGHLNERAFSYSIRQEHRARSHASLASLKFAAPPDVESGREELKKEREILQLVAGLGLGGDDLERREVPPGLYRLPR
ncbi:uncharacterized protein LOC143911588 isoform X2 [Arctopsyche grandis]